MKSFLLSVWAISFCVVAPAQKYISEKSFISFFSDAVLEDIKADNVKSSSIFNSGNGEIAFSVPMKQFTFEKKLMQEHFNEKYIESEKYPKSTFQGTIVGYNRNTTGIQKVMAKGNLEIHGVKREVEIPGTIETKGSKLVMKSKFIVKVADYKIEIPQLLFQNIAEEVEVTVEFTYKAQ